MNKVVSVVVNEFKAALQESIEAANTVMNDENAIQEEVDEAYDKLQVAIEGLEEAEIVDKSSLKAMVNRVLGLQENKYTESSWQAIIPVLEKANTVINDSKTTQIEVDNAKEVLTETIAGLETVIQ